jgi:hypothetical protein
VKTVRLVSLLCTFSVLVALLVGTFSVIFEALGFLAAFQAIAADPQIILYGFYECLGRMGTDYEFWAWNGPFVAIGLLILVIINSVT